MEKLGQEYRRRASPVQCHIPIPFRDRGMNLLNTTFLTSADAGGVIFQHQLEKMLGIPPVVLLLAHPLRSNLRRIAHPQLIVKLREQALEPTRVPGGLHPYAHADSFFLQLAVELLSLPTAVC